MATIMGTTAEHQILALLQTLGSLTAKDLAVRDIPREYQPRMAYKGLIERVARGRYRSRGVTLPNVMNLPCSPQEYPTVIALISALAFHGLGTLIPHELWWQLRLAAAHPTWTTL